MKFLTALVLFCSVTGIWTQLCIPDSVDTVNLTANRTLSWSASTNCPETKYIVTIEFYGIVEYEYTVDSLELAVSFLAYCRNYHFTVTPISDHVLGSEYFLDSSISLPDDVNIQILNFTGSQITDDVLIQWQIDTNYSYCISYYNLRIWDEDSTDPQSVYIGHTGHLLEHVAHCMTYQFQIITFYSGRSTNETFNYTVPAAGNVPSLVDLQQDTVTINTTWSLEPFATNRCTVTELYVNSTHFNETYLIVDTPERPDIQVSISGLRANTLYFFQVFTNNTAGFSQSYQIGVQTLPEEN